MAIFLIMDGLIFKESNRLSGSYKSRFRPVPNLKLDTTQNGHFLLWRFTMVKLGDWVHGTKEPLPGFPAFD